MEQNEFPSPQGGSETAADFSSTTETVGFHPLKAGRRLDELVSIRDTLVGFHPLKAGRRR